MELHHDRLIERGAAETLLQEALDRGRVGAGALIVLEGAPGQGKTSLLAELAGWARTDFLVRSVQATELEQALGWGVCRGLLADPARQAGQPILPAAARVLGLREDPGRVDDPLLASYALTELCTELAADQPLLLLVDDAQWADSLSMRWLNHLAARIHDLPVIAAVAARPGDPRRPAELTVLAGTEWVQLHRLLPLTPSGTAALVRRALPEAIDALCEACHRASGGNAFLVVELTRELRSHPEPPTTDRIAEVAVDRIDRVVARRVAAAGEHADTLARAAAVCGGHAIPADVAAVAGLDGPTAAATADLLRGVGVLDPDAGRLAFAHPLLRSAVERAIPAGERTRLHLAAAHQLEGQGEPVGQVASHLAMAEAGSDPWVRQVLQAAGQEAVAAGAARDAMGLYQRALAERVGPSRQLLVLLGRAALSVDPVAAEAPLRAAMAITPVPEERVPVALELSYAFQLQQRFHDGVLLLRPLAEELAAVGAPRPLRLRVDAELLTHEFYDLASRPGRSERMEAVAAEVRGEDDEEAMLLVHLAMHEVNWGTAERARDLATRAWADGRLPRLVGAMSASLNLVTYVHMYFDEPDWAVAVADRWATTSRTRGMPATTCFAELIRAEGLSRRGDLVDSLGAAEVAWSIAKDLGRDFPGWWVAISAVGQALLATGQSAAALRLLTVHGVLAGPPLEVMLLPCPRVVRAECLIAAGELEQGVTELLAAAKWLERDEPSPGAWHFPATLVDALLALGRKKEAAQVAHRWLARTTAFGAATTIGMAQRAVALTRSGAAQIEGLEQAEETLAGSPSRSEHARALVEIGAGLRRAGRRTAARDSLLRGLDAATRCGAAGLAERARAELTATGARPRRSALTGVEALSPSERRVAQLAADGLTNREVASALFISRKTVEHHLGSIYTKLGTSDRGQLAQLLG